MTQRTLIWPRWKVRCVYAATLLLTIGVSWLIAHEGHAPLPSKGATVDTAKGFIVLTAESRAALDVKAAEVSTTPEPETFLAYVRLAAPWQKHAFATSRLPGRVTKLFARPGHVVAAGEVLAEVASPELERLQLELLSADAEVRLSRDVLEGLRGSAGAVPGQDLLDAEGRVRQAENALVVAKAKWRGLGLSNTQVERLLATGGKERVNSFPVVTPIGGTVIHADLSVGRVVEPTEHLFEVVDLSSVWAAIGVLEKDIPRVVTGQTVELELTAYRGEKFVATVRAKELSLEPGTNLNTVWAELENPPGKPARLLPGMTGDARIRLPLERDVRLVPRTALIDDGVERYVLVEEANTAQAMELKRRNVELVRETEAGVVVRSPELFAGDRVVTRGAHELGSFFTPQVLRLSREARATLKLEVEPLTVSSVESVVQVPGSVDIPPTARAVASSSLSGTLTRVHIDRGQAVKAGQVVAEVQSLELQSIQLDFVREVLSVELLARQYESVKGAGDIVSRRKFLDLKGSLTAAQNRLESARQRLLLLGLTDAQVDLLRSSKGLTDTVPVRAPIDGVVVGFDKAIGQYIRAEEPVVPVHDLSRPLVRASVSERELSRVSVGQRARVRFIGADGVWDGQVIDDSYPSRAATVTPPL